MNDIQETSNASLTSLGAQTGAQKAGEFFVSRALNALVDGVKKAYSGAQVLLGTAFSRYLLNATQRYNQVKTLATGSSPRSIIGAGNVYVSIGVSHEEKYIATDTVDAMLRISNNLLIRGTGGIGKSMMMRYLFLNTADRGEYVPVLLELRKISNQEIGKISILDLIYTCLNDFDVKLPKEQFEYSLRLGKYLFLMDGFDEVKEHQAIETAASIQKFCAKYPKNPCIITSRPSRDTSPLETFTVLESLPLSKEQAVLLSSKIWAEDEKTREFCRQLDEELYEKHQDFAENPLLLSMMFLTFMRNNSVPNHLYEFYSKAYDALYSSHDSNDKGYYVREFRCNNLDEPGFRLILSHFCFQSYFKEDYEFSKGELLNYLQRSINKTGFDGINASDYLDDLQNVVCLIVEDGDIYRFSHRSFQAYFAACYTSNILTDEQQRKLFSKILTGDEVFWEREDYYELLSQIEPQRFAINALEEQLKNIYEEVCAQPDPSVYMFRLQYSALSVRKEDKTRRGIAFFVGLSNGKNTYYNYIALFRHYVKANYGRHSEAEWDFIRKCVEKVIPREKKRTVYEVSFAQIDATNLLTDDERKRFYDVLAFANKDAETLVAINSWLLSLEEKRKNLATADFIDDL